MKDKFKDTAIQYLYLDHQVVDPAQSLDRSLLAMMDEGEEHSELVASLATSTDEQRPSIEQMFDMTIGAAVRAASASTTPSEGEEAAVAQDEGGGGESIPEGAASEGAASASSPPPAAPEPAAEPPKSV